MGGEHGEAGAIHRRGEQSRAEVGAGGGCLDDSSALGCRLGFVWAKNLVSDLKIEHVISNVTTTISISLVHGEIRVYILCPGLQATDYVLCRKKPLLP